MSTLPAETPGSPTPSPPPGPPQGPVRGSRWNRLVRTLVFNPLTLCFGPIFSKEMRVSGRQVSVYWMRGAFVLVLLLLLCIGYLSVDTSMYATGNATRLQQFQNLAPVLAAFVVWTEFLILLFVAPMLTAPAISREKFARTLPALMTTPMSSGQIVFGKLCSSLVQMIILLLLPVPMLLAIRILGGLDGTFILGAMCIIVSSAILGSTLGLLFSCWHKKPSNAAAMALLALLAIMLTPPLIAILIAIRTNTPAGPADWIFDSSAPVALGYLTATMSGDAIGFGRNWWLNNTLINLGVSAIALVSATLALRSLFRNEIAGRAGSIPVQDPEDDVAEDGEASEVLPEGVASKKKTRRRRSRRARGRSRVVSDAPVLWRELRRGRTKPALLIVGGLCGLVGMLYLYLEFGPDETGTHMTVWLIGTLILLLQATNATSGGIANERESRTWDTLLTTPLGATPILVAKTLGGMRQLLPVAGLMLFDFVVGVLWGGVHPIIGLHLGAIIVASTVFLCGTGTLMSLLFARASTATVMTLLIAAGLWIGLPMLLGFISAISTYAGADFEEIAAPVLWINPVVLTVIAMEGGTDFRGGLSYSGPAVSSLSAIEFTALLAAPVLAGIIAGIGALWLAIRLFPSRCGRLS